MELKSAGIYVRVSTEKQVLEGYSINAQKENLINFAKTHNFKIYEVYSDEGISGKDIENRPSVKKLINDIKENKIDVVLLQQFDRLTRSISDTQEFINLFKKYDVDAWSINDGGMVDITTSNGRFMTLLKGLFGQHERELTAERIKIAFNRKAHEGYTLCCGCPPYGYTREKGNKIIKINEEEAKIVKKIFKMYSEGINFTTIAKILTTEGIPTKRQGQKINIKKDGKIIEQKIFMGIWTPKTIKLILSNPVYIGKVRYGIGRKDYYIGKGNHKQIINNTLWNKVQNKISKTKNKVHTNYPKETAYFCGSLICGLCGKKLTSSKTIGKQKKDGTRNIYTSYRCTNKEKNICKAKYISHKKVESAFINFIKNIIIDIENINNMQIKNEDNETKEINNIKKSLNIKKKKQKTIMNLFISEKINYNQFKYMNQEIDTVIKINEDKLYQLEKLTKDIKKININNISKNLADHWILLTNKEKLFFLNEFIKNITIVNLNNNKYNQTTKILNVEFF